MNFQYLSRVFLGSYTQPPHSYTLSITQFLTPDKLGTMRHSARFSKTIAILEFLPS